MNFAMGKDQSKPYSMGRLYFIDLDGRDGTKRLGYAVHGKKQMLEFEEILKEYCPGIELKAHGLLS